MSRHLLRSHLVIGFVFCCRLMAQTDMSPTADDLLRFPRLLEDRRVTEATDSIGQRDAGKLIEYVAPGSDVAALLPRSGAVPSDWYTMVRCAVSGGYHCLISPSAGERINGSELLMVDGGEWISLTRQGASWHAVRAFNGQELSETGPATAVESSTWTCSGGWEFAPGGLRHRPGQEGTVSQPVEPSAGSIHRVSLKYSSAGTGAIGITI